MLKVLKLIIALVSVTFLDVSFASAFSESDYVFMRLPDGSMSVAQVMQDNLLLERTTGVVKESVPCLQVGFLSGHKTQIIPDEILKEYNPDGPINLWSSRVQEGYQHPLHGGDVARFLRDFIQNAFARETPEEKAVHKKIKNRVNLYLFLHPSNGRSISPWESELEKIDLKIRFAQEPGVTLAEQELIMPLLLDLKMRLEVVIHQVESISAKQTLSIRDQSHCEVVNHGSSKHGVLTSLMKGFEPILKEVTREFIVKQLLERKRSELRFSFNDSDNSRPESQIDKILVHYEEALANATLSQLGELLKRQNPRHFSVNFNEPDPMLPGAHLNREELINQIWVFAKKKLITKGHLIAAMNSNQSAVQESFIRIERMNKLFKKRPKLEAAYYELLNAQVGKSYMAGAVPQAMHEVKPILSEQELIDSIELEWRTGSLSGKGMMQRSFRELQLELQERVAANGSI